VRIDGCAPHPDPGQEGLPAIPTLAEKDSDRHVSRAAERIAQDARALATSGERASEAVKILIERGMDFLSSPAKAGAATHEGRFAHFVRGFTQMRGCPGAVRGQLETHKMAWRAWA